MKWFSALFLLVIITAVPAYALTECFPAGSTDQASYYYNHCDGSGRLPEQEQIRMECKVNGESKVRWLIRQCGSDEWTDSGWGQLSTPPSPIGDNMPVTMNPDSSADLYIGWGSGGAFTRDGSNKIVFVPDATSAYIHMPAQL